MARKQKAKATTGKSVETLRHEEAKRRNIATAEYQSVIQKEAEEPLRVAYVAGVRDSTGGRPELAGGNTHPPRRLAARIVRQKEIDASIAAKAKVEYLYDIRVLKVILAS